MWLFQIHVEFVVLSFIVCKYTQWFKIYSKCWRNFIIKNVVHKKNFMNTWHSYFDHWQYVWSPNFVRFALPLIWNFPKCYAVIIDNMCDPKTSFVSIHLERFLRWVQIYVFKMFKHVMRSSLTIDVMPKLCQFHSILKRFWDKCKLLSWNLILLVWRLFWILEKIL